MSKDTFIHATQAYMHLLSVFDHMTQERSFRTTRITKDGVSTIITNGSLGAFFPYVLFSDLSPVFS